MSPGACRMCESDGLAKAGEVEGYRFYECGSCGFVFTPGLERADQTRYRTRKKGAPRTGWAPSPALLKPALARVKGSNGSLEILDFGAGDSVLPDRLRERGHRVVGVDLVPPSRPHPDRLTGDLPSLGLEADRFDLAYAYQVFEHLPERRPILRELLRLTRPGGAVLIHTDMETRERGEDLESWWYVLPPDHCSFYRVRTFKRAVEGTPHRVAWSDAKRVVIEVGGRRGRRDRRRLVPGVDRASDRGMNSLEVVDRLHRHRVWANARLVAASRPLDAERLRREFPIGMGSVWETLVHLYAAEAAWLEAIDGNPTGAMPTGREVPDFAALDPAWTEVAGRLDELVRSLKEDDLDRPVRKAAWFPGTGSGAVHTTPLVDALINLSTHALYTGAQGINMLRRLGVPPEELPNLQYITFARAEAGSRGS